MNIYKNHKLMFVNIYSNILPFRIFQDVDVNKLSTTGFGQAVLFTQRKQTPTSIHNHNSTLWYHLIFSAIQFVVATALKF